MATEEELQYAWLVVEELKDRILELEEEIRHLRAMIGLGGN